MTWTARRGSAVQGPGCEVCGERVGERIRSGARRNVAVADFCALSGLCAMSAFLGANERVSRIRNVCVVAHVDHGKTSLCDSLVASNGIISQKLAGKMRFMDSRADEQARGITMKASAITLFYKDPVELRRLRNQVEKGKAGADAQKPDEVSPYLINLVDSPGHVDFSSDVSTAVRLCDGALVIVDCVEGVCVQTHAVLEQAWKEGLKLTLVLNKLDRLILELQMTPYEAYMHINRIMEQVNALLNSFVAFERMNAEESGDEDDPEKAEDTDVSESLFFDPRKGNVIFASAIHCWAFHTGQFATIFSKSLGVRRDVLLRALWGDYYFSPKEKKILKIKKSSTAQPMFVTHVLENIWKLYGATIVTRKPKLIGKMIGVLKLQIKEQDLAVSDNAALLKTIMSAWLPIPDAVLGTIVRKLPSPQVAQETRIEKLWPEETVDELRDAVETLAITDKTGRSDQAKDVGKEMERVRNAVSKCDENGPLVLFIAKMVAVPMSHINLGAADADQLGLANQSDAKNTNVFIGFGRVFSGTLTGASELSSTNVYVLGPKYDPHATDYASLEDDACPLHHAEVLNSSALLPFSMMGGEYHLLKSARAGNILAVLGLGKHVLKTATVTSSKFCRSFAPLPKQAEPILTVAVEPTSPSREQVDALRKGLALLNQADACVDVVLKESGETLIAALGELHLERCLKDLRELFAPTVAFDVSKPLIMFKETLVRDERSAIKKGGRSGKTKKCASKAAPIDSAAKVEAPAALPAGIIMTPDKSIRLSVSARPMPAGTAEWIVAHEAVLKQALNGGATKEWEKFYTGFLDLLKKDTHYDWVKDMAHFSGFGPYNIGPNMFFIFDPEWQYKSPFDTTGILAETTSDESLARFTAIEKSLIAGVQLATKAGPMCEEPMHGVCFCLDRVEFPEIDADTDDGTSLADAGTFGPISGQVISSMTKACRDFFLRSDNVSGRLVEGKFRCNMQCHQEQLGKLYNVLNRRRADILDESLLEGTMIFLIVARIPVAESFGLADELRKETSGAFSSPQLFFDCWEMIDVDPYFKPITEDEREDHGESIHAAQGKNIAKLYIDSVRSRKGMMSDKKIVIHADKQRTLSRKK